MGLFKKRLDLWITLAAIAGILDSLYLVWIKLSNNPKLCIQGVGDCWSVNTSPYSEFLGIPISFLGVAAYTAILTILILKNRSTFIKTFASTLILGISLSGTLYSIYLTYLEIFVIKAICPFCVISAVLMVLLLGFSLAQYMQDQTDNNP